MGLRRTAVKYKTTSHLRCRCKFTVCHCIETHQQGILALLTGLGTLGCGLLVRLAGVICWSTPCGIHFKRCRSLSMYGRHSEFAQSVCNSDRPSWLLLLSAEHVPLR